jgi:hypothetical protein
MKRLLKYFFVVLLGVVFYAAGFVVPWDIGPEGTVSVAEAKKKKGDDGCGKKGCTPPTVSELSIQYMVAGGFTFILASGGIIFFIRNRSKKQSSAI